MRDYPPEYDYPCVSNFPVPELPDWLDPNLYWSEDGRVFVIHKDGTEITLALEVEDKPFSEIKEMVLSKFR